MLYQKADEMRANPPSFFQIPGLHELDSITTVQDCRVDTEKKAGIHFYLVRPANTETALPFVLNLHGGGMVRDHGDRDILFARRLAYGARCAVISMDYRLAPQFPYPYQIDETEALIDHLLQNAETYRLKQTYILSGQSSGGNLATAVTLHRVQRGGYLPQLLSLSYSWLDLNTDPYNKPDPCPDERKEFYRFYRDCYLDGTDPACPDISPACVRAEIFRGFPETLMIEGGLDELRDENLNLFRKLCDVGVPAQMHYFPESMHGFMVNQAADWKSAQRVIQKKTVEIFSAQHT